MSEPNPSEMLLNNLMGNPGKWFFLKKPKDQVSKKVHNRIRRTTMLHVETSLKLLSIPYQKDGDFKIRILKLGV